MTTIPNEPLATFTRIPGNGQFPWRVFFYTVAKMGFDRGQRVYMGKSQFAGEAEARAAVDAWNSAHGQK